MKITIEVPDENGHDLVEWLAGVKKPSKTAQQEISIVVSTKAHKRDHWVDTNAHRVPLLAITHDYVRKFELNDVVQHKKTEEWGVVVRIEADILIVKASKATRDATGCAELEIPKSSACHLV